jgi:Tol biopolymer transport system component
LALVLAVVFVVFLICALLVTPAADSSTPGEARGQIAFARAGGVYLVNADGSQQRRTRLGGLPYYSPDGRRMAFASRAEKLRLTRVFVANADGTRQRQIARLSGWDPCTNPVWSPHSTRIALTRDCEVDFMEIIVVRRDGTQRHRLVRGKWNLGPRWTPDGKQILFVQNRGSRNRQAFRFYLIGPDGRGLRRLPGSPIHPENNANWCWSRDGKTIYLLQFGSLFAVDLKGGRRELATDLLVHRFSLSPDGSQIVFMGAEPDRDWEIYVMQSDGTSIRQFTDNRGIQDRLPRWSPDGQQIAFTSERDGNTEIYVMNADGSNQTNISNNPGGDDNPVWVPPRLRAGAHPRPPACEPLFYD